MKHFVLGLMSGVVLTILALAVAVVPLAVVYVGHRVAGGLIGDIGTAGGSAHRTLQGAAGSSASRTVQRRQPNTSALRRNPSAHTDNVGGIARTISENPELMREVTALQNDPEIRQLINDPDIIEALEKKQYWKLLSDPRIHKLADRKHVHRLTEDIAGELFRDGKETEAPAERD